MMVKDYEGRGVVTSNLTGTSMLLLLLCILILFGCHKDLVIINYSQPANAYVFDYDPTGTPHHTTSAGDGMFAFYCIGTVENTDENAHDFKFNLSKVSVGGYPESSLDLGFRDLVETIPETSTVPAHSTSPKLGRLVFKVANAGIDSTTQLFNLMYESSEGESVLFARDDSSNPPPVQFLQPASPVHPNNLPICP